MRSRASWRMVRDSQFSWQDVRRISGESMSKRRKRFNASPLFAGKPNSNANIDSSFVGGLFTRNNFIIASIVVFIPLIIEAYSRLGAFSISKKRSDGSNNEAVDSQYYSFVPPPIHTEWGSVEHVTIVFHGAGGEDAYTNELMNRLNDVSKSKSQQQSSYNHIVNWSQYSTNILQASYNGQKVGKLAAREVLEQASSTENKLKTIHLIGISVGAFAADAAVNEIKKNFETGNSKVGNKDIGSIPLFVQITLLDPFQQRGIFGIGYGNNMFGKQADYAEQYLNTDDPVPSTNRPLKNTVCFDVTNLRPESIFGHDWPLVYYSRSDKCGYLGIENHKQPKERGERGSVVIL
eukprot:CAMPEP_0197180956 /NCGR_PEP_ID=MMETSP1423-20130617/5383_1 /TAXON_ID=476441 /ORGANISM="Pseudo-nitzschia heimii, Strain UNC1101" /LENGTH=348 /DNA_ID=CAMNT_0042631105 /DNA_START=188 /DNA_END=1234 /DNA_ORIENTATION=+